MKTDRRNFLKGALAAGSLAALGGCSTPRLWHVKLQRAFTANEKIRMAFIGIGGRGYTNLSMFAYYKDLIDVVAFCDVEMGAEPTQKALKAFPAVPRYKDFRLLFDDLAGNLDAVVISTPDFSHFPIAMRAMAEGLAVYCEKPMGNTFRECELMALAAAKHGVVTQMGNQGHSDANIWQCRALAASGFLKDITRINAFMCASRRWHKWNGTMREMPKGDTPPPELDWDVWQSQRPARDFSMHYIHGDWRCFYEYGTGALGDWGAHIFDAPWEVFDFGLPDKITVRKCEGATAAVYPMSSTLLYHFPARGKMPPVEIKWCEGLKNFPALPAKLTDPKYKRSPSRPYGSEIYTADGRIFARGTHGDPLRVIGGLDPRDPSVKKQLRDYPRNTSGHYLNFINAVKGTEKTNSPFEKAGPLSQVMVLGALVQRLGKGVYMFDRRAKQFIDNDLANTYLTGLPARAGWEEYERL